MTAVNFEAIWPKDSKFLALKDLNLSKKYTKNQEDSYNFRLGFALSNRPYLHRAYVVTVYNQNFIAVCIKTDACKFESIFGTAIKALDEQQGYSEEYTITMPEFTVDTDDAVQKYLEYVSALYFTIYIYLGLLEFHGKVK